MYIKRILLVLVLLGLLVGGVFAYMVYNAIFSPNTSFLNDEAHIYIKSTDDFGAVKAQLKPLLKDMASFDRVARQKGYALHIKGGKYEIRKGMNNNEIVNSLRSNNIPVKVSFNNQGSIAALAGRIAGQIEADSTDLVQSLSDIGFLGENGFDRASELALYIPNSYEFFWNTSAEGFRNRMLKEYERIWNDQRKGKAKGLGLTPKEVVTLASIVHKETSRVDERPKVAGVYLNRLKRGILLQADPTVIYAIKKETGNFDTVIKRVLFKDLEIDSPYNTYKYAGLPPGPITMPDISAVDAVLAPEKHDYLYFVADVENFGYHRFAKTLAQHNRNKEQYVRWINSQNIRR
ncbi:MAG: endolytic transglycosylase MltG [Flavobacteriaceae bacterium]